MATGSKVFRRSMNEVYNASARALEESGFQITEKGSNAIKASSGVTIRSWGEEVEVALSPNPRGTEVKITSKPKYQLFDLGKSEENVSIILSKLKKQLGE